jgi:hypothetical protein
MKILSPQEFYKKAGVDPAIIGAFRKDSWGTWNIELYTFTKYKCGCGKTHTYTNENTIIHWYKNFFTR